jgi:glutaredoxin 2
MSFTLYHYVHCPFCIRVRMALGFLNLKYTSKVLAYDDEVTPVKLTGKKMLPAFTLNEITINESLDIIKLIDTEKRLDVAELTHSESYSELDKLLNDLGSPLHSITMPYWIYTPEFNEESRNYFRVKKEQKRGPFTELVKNQHMYFERLLPFLTLIEERLNPFYNSLEIGVKDILIASHLWGLYIVPEFQFTESMHRYLQTVKQKCHFNYHQDFWS